MRLDASQLSFFAAFSKAPDGRLLLQMLDAMQAEADAKLRTANGEEVFRQQGRALALAELIGAIRGAEQSIERSVSTRTSGSRVVA